MDKLSSGEIAIIAAGFAVAIIAAVGLLGLTGTPLKGTSMTVCPAVGPCMLVKSP